MIHSQPPDSSPLSFERLRQIGQAIQGVSRLEELYPALFAGLLPLVDARGGAIWLIDETQQQLRCAFAVGPGAEILEGFQLALDEGASGWVAKHREPTCLGADHDGLGMSHRITARVGREPRSLMSAPLVAGGQLLGVLTVLDKDADACFTSADLDWLCLVADQGALAMQNVFLRERERRALELHAVLRGVGQHFHATLDLNVLLPSVFRELSRVLNCEALSLWLVDLETNSLVCEQAQGGAGESLVGMRVPVGQGLVGHVAQSQQPILIKDAQNDPRLYRRIDASTGFVTRSLICAPLVRQGMTLGAIQALNKRTAKGHFAPEDMDLLTNLADSAALAIENARLYKKLEMNYDTTLEALAAALDLRDRETEGHSRRVVAYTVLLARTYGLPEEMVLEIARGALLHDVGKIGVPDAILHKPASLELHEWDIIRLHPRLGFEILSSIPFLKGEAEIVLSHQERFDGTGYPRSLAGEAIPIGARLFAVADTYDAITSDRPYRPAKSHAEAVEEILRCTGTQFDPRAVEVFLSISESQWHQLRKSVMQEVQARRLQQLARQAETLGETFPRGNLSPMAEGTAD